MAHSEQWHWVDVDGTQYAVSEDELRELLRSGVLPAYVLVWKKPWGQWLFARNVGEFAAALSQRAEPPILPKLAPNAKEVPPPPIEKYEEAGHVRGSPLSSAALLLSPPVAPPPKVQEVTRRPIPIRNVMPTLTEDSLPGRSSHTLRPAGAMPPPPRAIPPQTRVPVFEEGDRASSESGDFGRVSVPDLKSMAGYSSPSIADVESPKLAEHEAVSPRPRVTKRELWTATLLGLCIPTAIVIGILRDREAESVVADPPGPSREVPASAGDSPVHCIVDVAPKRIAPSAAISAPPIFADVLESPRVAVGFATEEKRAVGMALDPVNLQFDLSFQKDVTGDITSVVPISTRHPVSFVIDSPSDELQVPRTIGEGARFTLGLGPDGIVRQDEAGSELVWKGSFIASEMTAPRVVSLGDAGHLVALRVGGRDGRIVTGLLSREGKPLSRLERIATKEALVGTPAVAASGATVLVTFAGRPNDKASWGLRFSLAKKGEVPKTSSAFPLPEGGPGQHAISPAAAGIAGDRYFVQWTEGATGSRVIRGVTLSSNLAVLGEPITLSPPGENAGQAVLWARADRAVALFFVRADNTHELWGTSLRCPAQ